MGLKITGIGGLKEALRAEVKKVEQEAIVEMLTAANVITFEMFKRTPVWKGDTVRNYKWSIGNSSSGAFRPGVIVSLDPTNSLPLGSEPNRGINQALALSDLRSLSLKKLENITLTNTVSPAKWDLIDNGSAPFREGLVPRNPGGVSKLAIQSARVKLKNFK